ncbi:hypothetical protein ARC63_07435 [Stenotrophomonas geniculata ATCC 19374 = JCM 13324]|nr:hypothetical protein ARC63_07435 [Stenotrophomonas geniculata ATCC 19374 = JCM 13324]
MRRAQLSVAAIFTWGGGCRNARALPAVGPLQSFLPVPIMKLQPLASSRMSELQWSEVKRLLPPALRARVDNRGDAYRQFIEAVFWVARGNAPWASIPEEAGPWWPIHVRCVRCGQRCPYPPRD